MEKHLILLLRAYPQDYRDIFEYYIIGNKIKNQKSFKKILATEELKEQVIYTLKNRGVEKILKIAEIYKGEIRLAEFYDDILKRYIK